MTPINPYLTPAMADVYFNTRLDTEAWEEADEPERLKALAMATEMVDLLEYNKPPLVDGQANKFPLQGQEAVPENVLKACCEIALGLLEGEDGFTNFKDNAVNSEGYSSVRISFKTDFLVYNEMLGLTSFRAYKYLLPWLALPSETVTLNRV